MNKVKKILKIPIAIFKALFVTGYVLLWKEAGDPKTSRARKVVIMLFFIGLVLVISSFFMPPLGVGTKDDKESESVVLIMTGLTLYLPLLFYSFWDAHKTLRGLKREMKELELRMIIQDEVLRIFRPEDYAKIKQEAKQKAADMQNTAKLFNNDEGKRK